MLRNPIVFVICCAMCYAMSGAIYAQSESKLEFEAATVKLATPDPRGYTVGCKGGPGTDDPTTFRCTNMSFTNLLVDAFNTRYDLVQGPDWLGSQMFEIQARVPVNTTAEQFRTMLQNLMAERFKMQTHREKKEMTVYALVVARGGPKFKEHTDDATAGAGPTQLTMDKEGYPDVGYAGMACASGKCAWGVSKAPIARLLTQVTAQMHRTVNDETGLKGEYDLKLHWMTESMARQEENGISLAQALQDQLGLKLESRKGMEEFLIVDHMDKLPSEN